MIEKSQIESHLIELSSKLADINGALVATLDGIIIVATGVDEKQNQLAAMTAAALGLGKRMTESVNAGELDEISFTGKSGSVFVYSLGNSAVLVVVTKQFPNVALVNWESKKTIKAITDVEQQVSS